MEGVTLFFVQGSTSLVLTDVATGAIAATSSLSFRPPKGQPLVSFDRSTRTLIETNLESVMLPLLEAMGPTPAR